MSETIDGGVTITADPETGLPVISKALPVLAAVADEAAEAAPAPKLREVPLPQKQLDAAREAVTSHAESLQASAVAGVELSRAIAKSQLAGAEEYEKQKEAARRIKRMVADTGVKAAAIADYDLEKGVLYLYPKPELVVDNTANLPSDPEPAE